MPSFKSLVRLQELDLIEATAGEGPANSGRVAGPGTELAHYRTV